MGTIPPPAKRWGGWRGAARRRAGWGVVQLRTNAPHPDPLPTTRKRSRGEGSGEARRVAFRLPSREKTPTRSPHVDIFFGKCPTTRTEMLRTCDFRAMLENYIFYISATYEFSHSLFRVARADETLLFLFRFSLVPQRIHLGERRLAGPLAARPERSLDRGKAALEFLVGRAQHRFRIRIKMAREVDDCEQ